MQIFEGSLELYLVSKPTFFPIFKSQLEGSNNLGLNASAVKRLLEGGGGGRQKRVVKGGGEGVGVPGRLKLAGGNSSRKRKLKANLDDSSQGNKKQKAITAFFQMANRQPLKADDPN